MTQQDLNPKTYEPLLISVALTGAVPTKSQYPSLPTEPVEIADQACRVAEHGASIVHIHMRDANGRATQNADRFAQTISLIRAEKPELIICATTTSRGSSAIEDRMAALHLDGPLLPDMASLTLGSYNTPHGVNINPPEDIEAIARLMTSLNVLPELEIFEPGMLETARRLLHSGVLPSNVFCNFLLGVSGASPASTRALSNMVDLLPPDIPWAAAGIGQFQKTVTALSVVMGGHVRVGMEDDPRGDHEGWTNVDAVIRARRVAESINRSIMTPHQARTLLKIDGRAGTG